jgi:hypothetical protein
MTRRKAGQLVTALIAAASFGWAAWGAHSSAIPELRVYDGYWMMMGAAIATLLVAPLVWHWRRELSLIAITFAALVGSVAPLALSAARNGMPLRTRLLGSWVLGGADVVGPALIIGFACLWFALREYQPHGTAGSRPRHE